MSGYKFDKHKARKMYQDGVNRIEKETKGMSREQVRELLERKPREMERRLIEREM